MSSCSQLPAWVSYLQALAVPILAIAGSWIAAQQMLIAYDKLQHDAFGKVYDRRVAVYEATREILADVFGGNISEDDIRIYNLKTLDALFLFDQNLYAYLKELSGRIASWNHASIAIRGQLNHDLRKEFDRIRNEHLQWMIAQGDEQTGFAVKFKPFLTYKPVNRPWPLRWPFGT